MVIWQAAPAADEHRTTQKASDEKGYRGDEEPQDSFYARKHTWCTDVTSAIRS